MSDEARLADMIERGDVPNQWGSYILSNEDRAVIVKALRAGAYYEELRQIWNGAIRPTILPLPKVGQYPRGE